MQPPDWGEQKQAGSETCETAVSGKPPRGTPKVELRQAPVVYDHERTRDHCSPLLPTMDGSKLISRSWAVVAAGHLGLESHTDPKCDIVMCIEIHDIFEAKELRHKDTLCLDAIFKASK